MRHSLSFDTYLTLEDAEVKVEVRYDHIPAERGGRYEPPVIEDVAIAAVLLTSGDGSGRRIDVQELLSAAAIKRLEDEAMEHWRQPCPF